MIPARYFVQESMIVKSSNAPRPAPPPPPPPLHANHAHLIDLVVKNDQYVTEQVRTLNMDVDEVEMKDDQGRTALHLALSRKDINIDLVHVLVEKGCGALSSKDNRGRLPLYVACENNAPLEIIKLLLEMNASTITRQHNAATSADKLPLLHVVIQNKHKAESGTICETLRVLVNHRSDLLQKRDKDGKTPLLYALLVNQDINVLKLLLELCPKYAQEKDNENMLPLHLACRTNASLEIIQMLVLAYPKAVEEQWGFLLPLHLSSRVNASAQVLTLLIDKYPGAITKTFFNRNYPLHLLVSQKDVKEDAVSLLLAGVQCKNNEGKLPLHNACISECPLSVIMLLVRAFPDALITPDSDGNIPLYYAHLNTDSDGNIPLYYAHLNTSAVQSSSSSSSSSSSLSSRSVNGLYSSKVSAPPPPSPSYDTMKFLIEMRPSSVELMWTLSGFNVLEWACKQQAIPIDLFTTILNAFPGLQKICDKEFKFAIDYLPLTSKLRDLFRPRFSAIHFACKNNASEDVLRKLLKTFPEQANKRDLDGKLPIDYLPLHSQRRKLFKSSSIEDLDSSSSSSSSSSSFFLTPMIKESRSRLTLNNGEGGESEGEVRKNDKIAIKLEGRMEAITPLSLPSSSSSSSFSKKPRFDSSQVPRQNIPSSSSSSVESTLFWKQGTGPATTGSVLVKLAQSGFTRESHQIIELSRAASLVGRDSNGGLPELWDVMGKRRGQNGITRLMAVCITSGSLSKQRAEALIRDHNANLMDIDKKKRTALHHALGARFNNDPWPQREGIAKNLELIQSLLHIGTSKRLFPKLLQLKDSQNRVPLHFACGNRGYPFKIIDKIINMASCDEAGLPIAAVKSRNGNLPLHLCCKFNPVFDVINVIVANYPQGILVKDKKDNLPLHLLSLKNASFEAVKLLAPKGTLVLRNLSKRYPLHTLLANTPTENEGGEEGGGGAGSNASTLIDDSLEVLKFVLRHSSSQKTLSLKDASGALPLHYACLNYASRPDIIKLLLDAYPQAAHETYHARELPLHLLVGSENASSASVQLLLDAYKESVSASDLYGNLAIHHALSNENVSFELIQVLIQANHTFTYRPNGDGESPLHIACRNVVKSFEIIQLLVQSSPNVLRIEDNNRNIPLFFACMNKSTSVEVIKLLIDTDPSTCEMKKVRRYHNGSEFGDLPIQMACRSGSSIETVTALIDKYPDCVKVLGQHQNLPIHCACEYNAPFDVIRLLVSLYPESLVMVNCKNETPLFLACDSKTARKEVIMFLLDKCRFAVNKVNVSGLLPLHVAISYRLSFEVIMSLFLEYRNAAFIKGNGYLPLHTAVFANLPAIQVLFIVAANAEAIRQKDKKGMLPIHHVYSSDVAEILIDAFPESLRVPSDDGRLAIHYACKRKDASYELIKLLLLKHPESEKVIDRKRKSPAAYLSASSPCRDLFTWTSHPAAPVVIINDGDDDIMDEIEEDEAGEEEDDEDEGEDEEVDDEHNDDEVEEEDDQSDW